MDRTLILELSSDDEVGLDSPSTADNFDWISKFFEMDSLSNGGLLFSAVDGHGDNKVVVDDDDDDDDDDSDDVVVVGEVLAQKPKKAKALVPYDDDDDDCVVLDGDPDKPKEEVKGSVEDSDDLLIVGETGQVACRDYPHPRHLCAKFPFSSTPHESRCDMCHCYVCDSLAPCAFWGSGVSIVDHCHAADKEEYWKLERKRYRQLKNPSSPLPITRPATGSLPQVPQVQEPSSGPTQLLRPTTNRGVPSAFGLPNIIRNQRSSTAVQSNRFQPHLISRKLLRSCNGNTQGQGNRGASVVPRMVSSHGMFKRSGLASRLMVANRPTYRVPNNASVEYLQMQNQLMTDILPDNNSINSMVSPSHLGLNPSFCLPSTSIISPGTSPLQLQGCNQSSAHTPTSHFNGGHSASVASNSPYVCPSINQAPNVPGLVLPSNFNSQNCSEIQSAVTQTFSGPNFSCSTPDVLSTITERSHQTSAEQSFSSPIFSSSMSNASNSVAKSCQQSAAGFPLVQGGPPIHEYLPSIEQRVQSDNAEQLEFDFENWLEDSESILGSQEESFLMGLNNQASVPAPVDAGMLYFDFETSLKGLTHL